MSTSKSTAVNYILISPKIRNRIKIRGNLYNHGLKFLSLEDKKLETIIKVKLTSLPIFHTGSNLIVVTNLEYIQMKQSHSAYAQNRIKTPFKILKLQNKEHLTNTSEL